MLSNARWSAALLLLGIWALPSVTSAESEISIMLDDPADKPKRNYCEFAVDGYSFNLCPILQLPKDKGTGIRRIWKKEDTPPTTTWTSYSLSLRGQLPVNDSIPRTDQCPEGTWVCKIVRNARGDQKPSIIQIVPIAGTYKLVGDHTDDHRREKREGMNITARMSPRKRRSAPHPDLNFIMTGGMYAGKNQSAILSFVCDNDAEEPSKADFGWQFGGYHVFEWRTKHACATKVDAAPAPDAPNTPDPTPETPDDNIPADQGGGGGQSSDDGQDLTLPDNNLSYGRWRSGIFSVFIAILVSGALVYVLYSYSPRIRELADAYLPLPLYYLSMLPRPSSLTLPTFSSPFKRPSRKGYTRFRPDERRLRSWAQEEGLEDDFAARAPPPARGRAAGVGVNLGTGGEEDFMVGVGSPVDAEEEDEEMPLAPSPRAFAAQGGRSVKSYGSAG